MAFSANISIINLYLLCCLSDSSS